MDARPGSVGSWLRNKEDGGDLNRRVQGKSSHTDGKAGVLPRVAQHRHEQVRRTVHDEWLGGEGRVASHKAFEPGAASYHG